jgi:hypothetical protein
MLKSFKSQRNQTFIKVVQAIYYLLTYKTKINFVGDYTGFLFFKSDFLASYGFGKVHF